MKVAHSLLSSLILTGLTIVSGTMLASSPIRAVSSDSSTDNISLTVPVNCTLTGTVNTAHTKTVNPGTVESDIGITTLKAACNDSGGFAIYTIGYTDDTFGKNVLTSAALGPSYDIATGTGTSGNSQWAMKLATNSGATYPITIQNSFDSYQPVPDVYTLAATRTAATDAGDSATGSELTTTYQVYASSSQHTGNYTGQVLYTLVHPSTAPAPFAPTPVVTNPGYISYNTNAPTTEVTDTMADQSITATATSAELWASNFQRSGYGFAGWNTEPDYSGTSYGPNETISFTAGQYSGSNPGLSLYAIWVPSAGDLQSWTGCSALTKANEATDILSQSITALTDQRDNQTYAVAKLADDNCWMIENLRLDNQYTTSAADIAKAQGYNSSFIGLANPENTLNWSNSTTANSLYSTDGSTSAPAITGSWQAYRFPRYNNQNTASPATNMTAWGNSANIYSVGNWYTWSAAVADTSYYNTSGTHADTSICPKGWHIPYGNNGTDTGGGNTSGGFYYLGVRLGATAASAASSNIWRSYPQNFIYSGRFLNGSAYNRGDFGTYWASTFDSTSLAGYGLTLTNSYAYPGTSKGTTYEGRPVRCLAQ